MAVRIAHFSDIHVTSNPRRIPWRSLVSKRVIGWANLRFLGRFSRLKDAVKVTTALVQDVLEQRTDHVVFTGDVTGLALVSEFEEAHGVLEPLLKSERITGIPGNHDVYVRSALREGVYERLFGPWEKSDWQESPPIVRLVGDDVALFGLVDSRPTAFIDSSGVVGPVQLARLRKFLDDERVRGRRRVVALHYGLLRSDGRPDTRLHGLRDAREVLDTLVAGGVDLILHGHLHRRFVLPRGRLSPIPIANPGSATHGTFERAYHMIDVSPDSIILHVRRYDPEREMFVEWTGAPGAGRLA